MWRVITAFIVTSIVVAPTWAHAQAGSAEAEKLFRDGKDLMKAKKFAEACEAFETSYKLDPVLNVLVNLADCREKNGQFASAWGLFVDAERATRGNTKQASLNRIASTRAAALEKRLSYLTISVPDESRVHGLIILRNGVEVDEGLWNRAVPVDGGDILVSGRAPGHEEWSTKVTLPNENGKVSVEVPRFKEIRTLEKPVSPDDKPLFDEPRALEPQPEPSSSSSGAFTGQRKLAVGLGIVGIAALSVGGWMGLEARDYDRRAFELCPDPETECADAAEATSLSDTAGTRALYANIGFGVGAAAIIGATILWFTGSPEESSRRTAIIPVVDGSSAALSLTRSF
jgi:hypothetical protein